MRAFSVLPFTRAHMTLPFFRAVGEAAGHEVRKSSADSGRPGFCGEMDGDVVSDVRVIGFAHPSGTDPRAIEAGIVTGQLIGEPIQMEENRAQSNSLSFGCASPDTACGLPAALARSPDVPSIRRRTPSPTMPVAPVMITLSFAPSDAMAIILPRRDPKARASHCYHDG